MLVLRRGADDTWGWDVYCRCNVAGRSFEECRGTGQAHRGHDELQADVGATLAAGYTVSWSAKSGGVAFAGRVVSYNHATGLHVVQVIVLAGRGSGQHDLVRNWLRLEVTAGASTSTVTDVACSGSAVQQVRRPPLQH